MLARMRSAGFSALIRDWPNRTNVLLVDRKALGIGAVQWAAIKFRYQHVAFLWRNLRGLQ